MVNTEIYSNSCTEPFRGVQREQSEHAQEQSTTIIGSSGWYIFTLADEV